MSAERPYVSVLVLNYNGRRHLEPCLRSLAQLDYPRERHEAVLVDNGSRDGSVALVHREFPDVRVQALERNFGFCGAYNRAVAAASGELVVLLNNDTRAAPGWLTALVACWQRRAPGCAAVASAMLTWDGAKIDFAGGQLNFHGFGFAEGSGKAQGPATLGAERPVAFGCGGALLVERAAFVDAGGFDEDYFAYFEDVDFGWRLWLLGREVWYAPEAVVYHRGHGSGLATRERFQRLELNALRTIVKNFEQRTLDRALPAALQLAVRRATLYRAGVAAAQAPEGRLGPRGEAVRIEGPALAPLLAIDALSAEWPRLLAKRAKVQARRRISDEALFARFGGDWRRAAHPEARYREAQRQVLAAHGLDALLPAAPAAEIASEPAAEPPPWWQLPARALEYLRAGGPRYLLAGLRLYARWLWRGRGS